MKTIILTGLWNTGKDFAAEILQNLGVNMGLGVRQNFGPRCDDELAYLFDAHPQTIPVQEVIRRRDALGVDWGTKQVMFWNKCSPVTMTDIFTNPRVIIMQRDLAVIQQETGRGEEDIAEEITRSLHWKRRLSCPVMHLSAEMMFRYPDRAQNVMASFCGVKIPVAA